MPPSRESTGEPPTPEENAPDRTERDAQAPDAAHEADRVAQRAYERFEERGGEHGRDQEDWFEAERELNKGEHG